MARPSSTADTMVEKLSSASTISGEINHGLSKNVKVTNENLPLLGSSLPFPFEEEHVPKVFIPL